MTKRILFLLAVILIGNMTAVNAKINYVPLYIVDTQPDVKVVKRTPTAPLFITQDDHKLRQFGIRLEQRELIGVLNTIPLNSLRFVVEETICSKCSDKVHQEIVDRPMSGVYEISFVLEQMVNALDDIPFSEHNFVP